MAKVKAPARAISNAGRLRVLEVMACIKAVGKAPTESSVEADGAIDMDYDKSIAWFEVQPEKLEVVVDGKPMTYTPDARYCRRTGVLGYREFKDDIKALDPVYTRKLHAVNEQLTRAGYEFDVIDAAELRRGHRMSNLRLLNRYARWPTSDRLRRQVQDFLRSPARHTLADLRELVGLASLGGLYRMLWEQSLGVDLVAAPLCAATPVWSVEA